MAKHLNYDDRLTIEGDLKEGLSLSAIARKLNRHKSTISREVSLRANVSKKGCYGRNYNACIYRYDCDIKTICEEGKCTDSHSSCKYCKKCNDNCKFFKEEVCSKLNSLLHVCNGCCDVNKCTLTRKLYTAKEAQKEYEKTLVDSRLGLDTSLEEINGIDAIIAPLVKQGQSIHHIHESNKDQIMVSERTLYNYIETSAFTVKNIDLPRKVRYRPRKKYSMGYKVDKKCLVGRRYEDFLKYLDENKDISIVQMDTVEGKKGGKVLLTIHFIDTSFMLMLLRDANDSKSVSQWFERIFVAIGPEEYKRIFPLLLGDNGSEFSDPEKIENIHGHNRLTKVFYCLPYSAFQKPEIENNHQLIRRVIPKGTSMDHLTQEDINLLMSHINSYARKKLNDQTPFDAFSSRYGFKLIDALGITKIPANEIILNPTLLK